MGCWPRGGLTEVIMDIDVAVRISLIPYDATYTPDSYKVNRRSSPTLAAMLETYNQRKW